MAGRGHSAAFPFRQASFAAAAALGLICVAADVHLICRYVNTAPQYVVLTLSFPIGIQLVYQWWRALRYRAKLRELYKASVQTSCIDVVVRVAAAGIIDTLFYSYGIAIFALILVGALLHALERH